jgi:hypothetical protein
MTLITSVAVILSFSVVLVGTPNSASFRMPVTAAFSNITANSYVKPLTSSTRTEGK